MSPGAQQEAIKLKIAESNARIADLENKALHQSRFRDIEAANSETTAARKVKNETIGGIVLLVCIVAAFFILFFVL